MTRLLKLDTRPPGYDSVAEAVFQAEDEGDLVDAAVESATWEPVRPAPADRTPRFAFVDGVERRDGRVSAEGDGLPLLGMLVSYGAGSISPGAKPPLRHVSIARRIVLTKGAQAPAVRLSARNTVVEYLPAHNASEDPESLDRTLKELRSDLEAEVVRCLIVDGAELIVVDGRLPPIKHPSAIGFIKTPHRLPITQQEHLDVLLNLKRGERSPVFVRQRSARLYYSWFVCLQNQGPLDIGLSNLAMLEMDDETPRQRAIEIANITASLLPAFAPSAYRDARAPQNLMPVGQLERELRHRLGDMELLKRMMMTTFAKESPTWNP